MRNFFEKWEQILIFVRSIAILAFSIGTKGVTYYSLQKEKL